MKHTLFSLLALFLACQDTDTQLEWTILLKTDHENNILIGSKSELIKAIRQGVDIKVGWGHRGKSHTIEHLSTPTWIGLLDSKEVVIHLDPQVFPKINWEHLNASYEAYDYLDEEWRVVITTSGTFDAVWIDQATKKVVKRRPQKHKITWYAKRYNQKEEAIPLFE